MTTESDRVPTESRINRDHRFHRVPPLKGTVDDRNRFRHTNRDHQNEERMTRDWRTVTSRNHGGWGRNGLLPGHDPLASQGSLWWRNPTEREA